MFCKYGPDELLGIFKEHYSQCSPQPDAVTDYFGAVTPVACAPYLTTRAGSKVDTPPIPDDTLRAGFIEYAALVDSVRFSNSQSYQMCEIGASYAPFTALAGVLALRKGVKQIVLCPTEASPSGEAAINRNLASNDLLGKANVRVNINIAAAASSRQQLFFPDIDCTVDNGGATSEADTAIDVRGAAVRHVEVTGLPLDVLLSACSTEHSVDLVHMDIQGGEETVIPDSIGLLNTRVQRLMVATHSREIEAILLNVLHRNGWMLMAEEPVVFTYRQDLKSYTGMTTKDGAQYWVNSRVLV
jgi:hypothetical protein